MPETSTPKPQASRRISVTETNLRKTASRVLSTRLVSPEIEYLQRQMGSTATQEEMDAKVLAVRALPWSAIAPPD